MATKTSVRLLFLRNERGDWNNGEAETERLITHPLLTANCPVKPQTAPLLLVLLIVDSLHFVFAGLLRPHMAPAAAAMYVLTIATIQVALYLFWRGEIAWPVFARHWRFFLIIGFLVAGSTAINYAAVAFIDPGTASLLGKAGILFSLGLSFFWLREKLSVPEGIGTLITLAGVGLISFQPGNYWQIGSLLVLSSALMYALHAAIIKRYGGDMPFGSFFFFRVASTAGFLWLFVLAGEGFQWPSAAAWPVLILAGTVDVVVSRVLYYWTLRRWQMNYHTIILSLSPVLTLLFSLLLFGKQPTWQGWMGGGIVLIGVLLVTAGQSRRRLIG